MSNATRKALKGAGRGTVGEVAIVCIKGPETSETTALVVDNTNAGILQGIVMSVNGGGNCSVASARDAMGIRWMTRNELNEAIPPAYTQWVGKQLMEHIGAMRQKIIKAC